LLILVAAFCVCTYRYPHVWKRLNGEALEENEIEINQTELKG